MVRLNKIYTRTGDEGTTGLADGSRRPKNHPRIAAYGTVDETNAAIGLARLHTAKDGPEKVDAMLARIQNDLFDLGADLATPESGDAGKDGGKTPALRIVAEQVARLEAEIDELNAELSALKSFVLPGGTPAAAHLHLARTVCRRAERLVFSLSGKDAAGAPARAYINRLSDFLFVAARYCNDRGGGDILWVPGENR